MGTLTCILVPQPFPLHNGVTTALFPFLHLHHLLPHCTSHSHEHETGCITANPENTIKHHLSAIANVLHLQKTLERFTGVEPIPSQASKSNLLCYQNKLLVLIKPLHC